MKRPLIGIAAALAAVALMVSGTTKAPAQSMGFPAKDKAITFIVPWGAGGGSDTSARLLVPSMERTLGVKIQVLNKPGGGSQLGITALADTKPDGYTIGLLSMPAGMTVYLDPDRKARFSRKDLAPVALMNVDPQAVIVGPGSPYKTLEDLVSAAKAKPNTIRASITGLISDTHLGVLMFMKATGTEIPAGELRQGYRGIASRPSRRPCGRELRGRGEPRRSAQEWQGSYLGRHGQSAQQLLPRRSHARGEGVQNLYGGVARRGGSRGSTGRDRKYPRR